MRSDLVNPGPQLLETVVRQRHAALLGKSPEDLPLFSGMSRRLDHFQTHLHSSLCVHCIDKNFTVGARPLSVGSSGEDDIGILGALISVRADVDNEGVSGDVFGSDAVIASQKENDLRPILCFSELYAQLESVDLALAAVQDVVSVPATLSVDELVGICHLFRSGKDGGSVASGKRIMANDQKWQFCSLQLLAHRVSALGNLRQNRCAVAQMSIPVGEVSRSTDVEHPRSLLVDSLQNPGIQNRCLSSGIDSDEEDGICVLDALDLGVEEVVGPEIVGKGEVVARSELVVEAVEGVEEVLKSLDVFNTLELSNSRRDVLPLHLVDPR